MTSVLTESFPEEASLLDQSTKGCRNPALLLLPRGCTYSSLPELKLMRVLSLRGIGKYLNCIKSESGVVLSAVNHADGSDTITLKSGIGNGRGMCPSDRLTPPLAEGLFAGLGRGIHTGSASRQCWNSSDSNKDVQNRDNRVMQTQTCVGVLKVGDRKRGREKNEEIVTEPKDDFSYRLHVLPLSIAIAQVSIIIISTRAISQLLLLLSPHPLTILLPIGLSLSPPVGVVVVYDGHVGILDPSAGQIPSTSAAMQ